MHHNSTKIYQIKGTNLKDLKWDEMGFKQRCTNNKSINIRHKEWTYHRTTQKLGSFAMSIFFQQVLNFKQIIPLVLSHHSSFFFLFSLAIFILFIIFLNQLWQAEFNIVTFHSWGRELIYFTLCQFSLLTKLLYNLVVEVQGSKSYRLKQKKQVTTLSYGKNKQKGSSSTLAKPKGI